MVKRIILTIIIVMGAGVAVTEPAPDSAIEDALVSSLLFIDDPASAREEFEYAKQLSGYDTNRLARLIAGLARTNDSWIAGGMIGRLGVYGSSENLPFLYSQVSNVEYVCGPSGRYCASRGLPAIRWQWWMSIFQ